MRFSLFPAKKVGNAVPGYAEHPRRHLLNRLHHPVRFDQFVEDVLQNVFGIAGIRDTLADEFSQSGVVASDRIRDALVRLSHQPLPSQRLVHHSCRRRKRRNIFEKNGVSEHGMPARS